MFASFWTTSVLSLLLLRPGCAADQEPLTTGTDSPLDSNFDNLVQNVLDHWHVPGLAIAVVHREDTHAKGYGIAIFPDTPVTPQTLFYTGSTTKSFTAAAVSLLIEDTANSTKALKWTTTMSSLIRDDFVLPDDYSTNHVTLEDALSHRTGMPRHDKSYGGLNFTVRDMVRSLRYLPMTAELRTRWQYCNMMFVTVSHAIETLTGMWLGDFLRIRIWEPLMMSSTFFSLDDAQIAERDGKAVLARGYYWDNKKYIPEQWDDALSNSGAGSVISNVLDYSKWLRAMIHRSLPFSQEGHSAFRTSRSFSDPTSLAPFTGPSSYTLGWVRETYRGEEMFWHDGAMTAFGALMLYIPARRWGTTLLGNTGGTSNWAQQTIAFTLIDDLLDTPEDEQFDWMGMYNEQVRKGEEDLRNARKRLYPLSPKSPISLTLPLNAYTGLYSHGAYQNLTLRLTMPSEKLPLADPSSRILHADALDRTWPSLLDFEHVSGEFFLMYSSSLKMDGSTSVASVVKAEFQLSVDGKVERMGIAWEAQMGEEKIWFAKI